MGLGFWVHQKPLEACEFLREIHGFGVPEFHTELIGEGKSTETLGLIQQKESVVFGDVVSETVIFRVSKWNI